MCRPPGGNQSVVPIVPDTTKHKGGHTDEYPDPARTPEPNIDKPPLPPTEPVPIPEQEPPENQPPPMEDPPQTAPPLVA